ncbi:MAG: sensor histidine kinase [Chloroflexota bacterium]
MNDKTTHLETFLTETTATLQDIERRLTVLAQSALSQAEQPSIDSENGQHGTTSDTTAHLQNVGRQLLALTEQSHLLQTALQMGQDMPQIGDHNWSQIRILQSQEEERAQLARTLEDSVGQLLANAAFELASCRSLLETRTGPVAEGLDALQSELEQGLTDLRYFITDLEPATILNNFGLGDGIRRYLEQYEKRTALKTELRVSTNIGRLPSIVEITIFRVLQEALNNVYRHAHATQIDVTVDEDESAFIFSVIDNGTGLSSEQIGVSKRNLGLARMVDYADLLQGKLRVLSEPGQGTQVILSVPYPTL